MSNLKINDTSSAKNLGGRKKKNIDFYALEQLCAMHCTQREICSFFRVDHETLSARIREVSFLKVEFSDFRQNPFKVRV